MVSNIKIKQPIFSDEPKSIGEYQKNDIFVEIQFETKIKLDNNWKIP